MATPDLIAVEVDEMPYLFPVDGDPVEWAWAMEEAATTDQELDAAMTAWKVAALVLAERQPVAA